jgi:hypothetical protein
MNNMYLEMLTNLTKWLRFKLRSDTEISDPSTRPEDAALKQHITCSSLGNGINKVTFTIN